MSIREYCLPVGWYPRNPDEIARFLADFTPGSSHVAGSRAAIAPHAGWFYSGRIAARAASSLERDAETVIVMGGHLPGKSPALFALEDGVHTPLGIMPIDTDLRDALMGKLAGTGDRYSDNTVEVLLPMVRFFFPDAALLWLRLPADDTSFEAGKTIAHTLARMGRKAVVLASTDLTHYGRNYGFSPHGSGPAALQWMSEVNDANFIRAVESGDPAAVLDRAEQDRSSCSAGAVLGALGFAEAAGAGPARMLEYGTSADAAVREGEECPDSFVGYAAFTFGNSIG
ncbi:MAG: AmmeMemoRadiSam system protein B [Treponema sp.]|jgi:AmmeMemoRadiSam system protein B|nr:AmmeMemoRadiSam system protein B [Treponema sp.]